MDENQTTWIGKQVRGFLAALRFLTVIPFAKGAELDGEYFKQSLLFFPIIGIIIGSLGALLTLILQAFLPQPVVVCLLISYLAFISGCLHLDGLSDTGDGLLSSRPRERSMEIMKDSRVGAMGVIVTIVVILTKYSALISVDPRLLPLAIFFMPFAGRVAILCTMAMLPYARSEGGLGVLFYSRSVKHFACLGVVLLLIGLALFSIPRLFVVLFFLILILISFNYWCNKKIGGATGDTLGANCELAEMAVALAFSATLSVIL